MNKTQVLAGQASSLKTIVTLTMNPALDQSTRIERVIPEQKLRCQPSQFHPGGGGINVSRAIRFLGGTSVALYLVGGPDGQVLQELLKHDGIHQQPIPIAGQTRESFAVLEESTGQQYRFSVRGPTVQPPEWQACLHQLRAMRPQPDYIVASGGLPPGVPDDFYAQVADSAASLGAQLIVDTTGEPLRAALQRGVYLIKPNLRELGRLIEQPIQDEIQLEIATTELIKRGESEAVVVSLGAAGAFLVTQHGHAHIPAPIVPIQSKIGAGDSMVAGIVLSLAQGKSLFEATRLGVAAGAAAVMNSGTELCRREDTERLYERMSSEAAATIAEAKSVR